VSGGVLVTGGGTGIGAAVARGLAADGYRVMVSGRRETPLREIAEELGCGWATGDTSDPDQAEAVVPAPSRSWAASTAWSATPASAARGR